LLDLHNKYITYFLVSKKDLRLAFSTQQSAVSKKKGKRQKKIEKGVMRSAERWARSLWVMKMERNVGTGRDLS